MYLPSRGQRARQGAMVGGEPAVKGAGEDDPGVAREGLEPEFLGAFVLLVMHDLDERAADLAAGSEVVLVIENRSELADFERPRWRCEGGGRDPRKSFECP